MLVYRPDGVAENKDTCDARECVKYCGYTTEPKGAAKPDAPKDVDVQKQAKPTAKPTSAYQPNAATVSTTASLIPVAEAKDEI